MSESLKDRRGQFICTTCGTRVARVWTAHRRTETDHLISYQSSAAAFTPLARDGDIEAFCRDEYQCFACCYETPQADEVDEPADLEPGQVVQVPDIEERVELAEESPESDSAQPDSAPPASSDTIPSNSAADDSPSESSMAADDVLPPWGAMSGSQFPAPAISWGR